MIVIEPGDGMQPINATLFKHLMAIHDAVKSVEVAFDANDGIGVAKAARNAVTALEEKRRACGEIK